MTYFLSHIIPVLGRVHTGLKWRGPRCCVHSSALVLRARKRLPVDEEGDRVLSLRDAVVRRPGCDACRGAGDDPGGHGVALHHPAVDVDVVRGEVVAVDMSLFN